MVDWWSETEHAIVECLEHDGPMSPEDLARRVGISEGEATAFLGKEPLTLLLTAQAADSFGNPVSTYNGPSSITATASPADPQGNFPINAQVNASGLAFFVGNLQTAGSYAFTAAGASTSVVVTPASAQVSTSGVDVGRSSLPAAGPVAYGNAPEPRPGYAPGGTRAPRVTAGNNTKRPDAVSLVA